MEPAAGMGAGAVGVASLPTADPIKGGSAATYESVLVTGDGVDTASRPAGAAVNLVTGHLLGAGLRSPARQQYFRTVGTIDLQRLMM
jgi:hypothetical protein